MFWFICLTTLTAAAAAMASYPIYKFLQPVITSKSLLFCQKLTNSAGRWLNTTSVARWPTTNNNNNSTNNNNNNNTNNNNNNNNKFMVYTRTGDKGTSALYSGERRPKDDMVFEALGTTDELTSAIGVCREFVTDQRISQELEQIQCILQDLQATVATPKTSSNEFQIQKTKWNINHLVDIEEWIEYHSENLSPLKNFILPSGGKAASFLHLTRSICRRAERRLVPLLDEGLELPVLQYLNRLSSYLFTVARVCAKIEGRKEVIYWERPKYNS